MSGTLFSNQNNIQKVYFDCFTQCLSLFHQFKYQINIDGTVAAYRFPYLLAGDGVVFKQESEYYEHFYPELQPFVHYVPFKHDLSDLREKIQWARDNDDKVIDWFVCVYLAFVCNFDYRNLFEYFKFLLIKVLETGIVKNLLY